MKQAESLKWATLRMKVVKSVMKKTQQFHYYVSCRFWIYAKDGRQFGWILDQSLMDMTAMIIIMMMVITQQYKHKVAIELTLSRNYNKYDIIIIKAHLWLALSLLCYVWVWVRIIVSHCLNCISLASATGTAKMVILFQLTIKLRIFLPCLV